MNNVSGKIIHTETNFGIPNLLVVFLDVNPGTAPEEILSTTTSEELKNSPDRLGSVLSDLNGSFSLSFEDVEFKVLDPKENRLDLSLQIFAPEDAASKEDAKLLYQTVRPRQNAGRTETFIIKISTKQLQEAGISVPVKETDIDIDKEAEKQATIYKNKNEIQLTVEKKINAYRHQTLESTKTKKNAFVKKYKKELTNIKSPETLPSFFVDTDAEESIKEKHSNAINLTLSKFHNYAKVQPEALNPETGLPVWFYLSEKDKEALQPFKTGDYYIFNDNQITDNIVIKDIVQRLLSSDNGLTGLTQDNPISRYLKDPELDESLAINFLNNSGTEVLPIPPGDITTDNIETITSGDIPTYIARLIKDMPPPEAGSTLGQMPSLKRPDQDNIQESVNTFQLQKGPAETTASYDFNVLQIAFDHVWQQLFDTDLENLLNDLYQAASDKGVDVEALEIKKGKKAVYSLLHQIMATIDPNPPAVIVAQFDISSAEWKSLNKDYKDKLTDIAGRIEATESDNLDYKKQQLISRLKERGERIIETARTQKGISLDNVVNELSEKLKSDYSFKIFAADRKYSSINFGLLNTYRQNWEPVAYQVGDLIKSIPLSAKEERKYSLKTTVNKKKAVKEAEKNSTSDTSESTTTEKAESEIIKKINLKADIQATTSGSFDALFSEGSASITVGASAERDTQNTKKALREAVKKATHEYKSERSREIDTEQSYSSEYNESGTIVNPNDELAVTYLFYELQKRYRVSEQLYRIMPVVLVAQQMPQPEEINETWIIEHDWILQRYLLDKSFRPALNYITKNSMRDDLALKELRKNLVKQRQVVDLLTIEVASLKEEVNNKYAALETSINERIGAENNNHSSNAQIQGLYGYDRNEDDTTPLSPEAAKAYEEAAKESHAAAVKRSKEATAALLRESNTLHRLTEQYNRALTASMDNQKMVVCFQLHIKKYILHYMQAIWSMEHPDQRYFRLIDIQIPFLETDRRRYAIKAETAEDIFEVFRRNKETKHRGWIQGDFKTPVAYKPLVEVADLGTPLGFKGNYMMFPLKQHNALTEFMAAPYVDAAFGAMDPDALGNVGLQDYAKFIVRLHEKEPEEYERLKPALKKWLELLLADPLRNGDELVVPTDSLYIEALPSAHTILEDFKLRHRAIDVQKVQAEVRKIELENIRYAARLLNGEREDAHIDKVIKIEGNNDGILNPTE